MGFPSTQREVSRIWLRKRYRSLGQGFTLETTLRDEHNNELILTVDPKKCLLSDHLKNSSLNESFPDFSFT